MPVDKYRGHVVIPRIPPEQRQGLGWFVWMGFVFVQCHNGHRYRLQHAIDDMGFVDPSIECPTEGCTWHVHAVLDQWIPKPKGA